MATFIGDATQTSPSLVSNGAQRQARLSLDGSLITADWVQAAIAEGIMHGVNTGTGTAPDTFNATYAAAEQDIYIFVPEGVVIIPTYIGVVFEDTGTAKKLDVFAAYSSNGDSAVTGDARTIYNVHTLASPGSACTATAVVTGSGATHLGGTDFLEFWRPYAGFGEDAFAGSTAATMRGQFSVSSAHWSAKSYIAPIIGAADTACALSVYAAAQAGLGFITVEWAEYPAARFP